MVLNEQVRMDGRQFNEIRPIWSEVDYLPMPHGSAVFTRGETQSISSVTLGTKLDEQMIDSALIKDSNTFILHYNFPAFSTGEVALRWLSHRYPPSCIRSQDQTDQVGF